MGKGNSRIFILVFLGMLSAFGPFVTDMYLPTLPAMADYFSTTSSMVQLGLTFSMVGLAAGQLLFGPLSDRYGRKKPLVAAMAVFLVATAGCLCSRTIGEFVAMRLLQGIAGAGGIVIARSVAADMYSGRELATMLAIIGAVNGVAPVAAPIGGGLMADTYGWQGIFRVLFVIGLLLLAGSVFFRETVTVGKGDRTPVLSGFWKDLRSLVSDRVYMCCILQFGFAQGAIFTNIASAPFIMQGHYGFTPAEFSVWFGVNALFIVVSAALSVRFRSMEKALYAGSTGMLAVSAVMMPALIMQCSFAVYELLMVCLLSMLGLTFTSSNALAMDAGREHAGTASAVLGAVGFAFGGIVSPLAGMGNIMVPSGILFFTCSLASYLCVVFLRKGR